MSTASIPDQHPIINLTNKKSTILSLSKPTITLNTKTSTTVSTLSVHPSIREVYLKPLLERHNAGKAILYEDLESSYQKANEAIHKLENSQKTTSLDGLTKLHQSQLEAYEEAAKIHLKCYSQQYKPPPISSNNIQQNEYIQKCIESSKDDCAGWRVDQLTIDNCVVVEVTTKARHYFTEQKKLLNIETVSDSNTCKKDNTETKKLSTIEEDEEEEGEDAEQCNEETVSDDVQNEEITSEEDGEEEEENGEDEETLSNNTEKTKASRGDNSSDGNNAQTPTKKNPNVNSSQPKTKISLLKVTRGKRPASSNGGQQAKNAKTRKINSSSGNTAQGKKSRGGRGRGRGRRRGGKN